MLLEVLEGAASLAGPVGSVAPGALEPVTVKVHRLLVAVVELALEAAVELASVVAAAADVTDKAIRPRTSEERLA